MGTTNGGTVNGLTVILDELIRLRLVDTSSDNKGHKTYLLNLQARNAINGLPKDFDGKPYQYFLDEEKKRKDAESIHLFHKRENEKSAFVENPKTIRQRNWLFFFAIIELIIIVIQFLRCAPK